MTKAEKEILLVILDIAYSTSYSYEDIILVKDYPAMRDLICKAYKESDEDIDNWFAEGETYLNLSALIPYFKEKFNV